MTSEAHVEFDPMGMGVRIMLRRRSEGGKVYLLWPELPLLTFVRDDEVRIDPDIERQVWLRLYEDDARAVYEELADYFGHAGHDIRALRKDYDSERTRVDRLITFITGGTR